MGDTTVHITHTPHTRGTTVHTTDTGGTTVHITHTPHTGGTTVHPMDPGDPGGTTVHPMDPGDPGGTTVHPMDPGDPGGTTVHPMDPGDPGDPGESAEALGAEVRVFPKGKVEVITISGATIGRAIFEPGWVWSTSVQPIAKITSWRPFSAVVRQEPVARSSHQVHIHTGRRRIRNVSQGSSTWPALVWASLMQQYRGRTTAA